MRQGREVSELAVCYVSCLGMALPNSGPPTVTPQKHPAALFHSSWSVLGWGGELQGQKAEIMG